jgi:hypothetical protein
MRVYSNITHFRARDFVCNFKIVKIGVNKLKIFIIFQNNKLLYIFKLNKLINNS